MKFLIAITLASLLAGCSPASENPVALGDVEAETNEGTGSFRMRSGEIRADMIRMMNEEGIEFSLSDDDIITYNLADGEAIDRIGNEARSEYITRN